MPRQDVTLNICFDRNPRHIAWTEERLAVRRNRIRSTVVNGEDLLRIRPSYGPSKVSLRSFLPSQHSRHLLN